MATWLCSAWASNPCCVETTATPVSSQELSKPRIIMRVSVQLERHALELSTVCQIHTTSFPQLLESTRTPRIKEKRSTKRRVRKGCVRKMRSSCSPYTYKKNKKPV